MTAADRSVGTQLCKAIGVDPKHVTSLTLRVVANEPPSLHVEMWDLNAMREVENIVARYEFVTEMETMGDWVLWRDPPPDGRSVRPGGNRGHVTRLIERLQAEPGRWAQYRPGHNHPSSTATNLQRKGLQTRLAQRVSGKWDIYFSISY